MAMAQCKVQDWGFSCRDNWEAQIGQFDIKQGCDGGVFSYFLSKGTLAMWRMTSGGREAPEFQVLSKLRRSSMNSGRPTDQSLLTVTVCTTPASFNAKP